MVVPDNSLHVVLNAMLPIQTNPTWFNGKNVVSIHAHRKHETGPIYWGMPERKKFSKTIQRSFVVQTKGKKRELVRVYATTTRANFPKCKSLGTIDTKSYALHEQYPEKKWMETTGFVSWLLLRQVFGNEKVTLVNFAVHDKSFFNTAKIHGIEFESVVYQDEKADILIV